MSLKYGTCEVTRISENKVLKPKSYFTYRRFNIQQFHVLCFVWISEQTTNISLNDINWLVFIREI